MNTQPELRSLHEKTVLINILSVLGGSHGIPTAGKGTSRLQQTARKSQAQDENREANGERHLLIE